MPPQTPRYLSTTPTAGTRLEPEYLSTDPQAGTPRPSAASVPVADDPTRPRTLWERLTGTTTEMPPDVAAQYHAVREQVAGRQAPPGGDVVVQNAQGLASYGPAIGATVGGIYGGPPGAAAGGAVGEGVNLLLNPAHRSDTALGMAGQVAGQGALAGTVEAVVPVVGRGITRGAEQVYRGYLKPSLAEHLLPRAKEIVQTALREALPITEAGAARAQTLIADLNLQVNQMLSRARGQTVDLHAIAERVRDFARRKYYRPGRSLDDYQAALRVADTIDQHPSLGLPPGARPTRLDVDLPTAQDVKLGLRDPVGEEGFGVATGVATKETRKAGGHELRRALEREAPGVAPLNVRERQLIDAAEAINRAVAREANQNVLLGAKTVLSGVVGAEEYGRTGNPYRAAVTAILLRRGLSPAVVSRVAIVASRLGQANHLVPASAVRVALQAVLNQTEGGAASAPSAARP